MRTSEKGIAFIKRQEGLRLYAYPDPATGGEPFTIAHGHTGLEVHLGMFVTPDEAESLLRQDLKKFEAAVSMMVVVPLEQHEFDACVSLAFNIGAHAFGKSTLVLQLNKGAKDKAANEFLRWTKADGHEMPGLVKRRAAERAMFLGEGV